MDTVKSDANKKSAKSNGASDGLRKKRLKLCFAEKGKSKCKLDGRYTRMMECLKKMTIHKFTQNS